jgi:hypothetical protein
MIVSCDSTICVAASYELNGRGSFPYRDKFFSSPQSPHQLWGLTSLLSNGYCWQLTRR